MPAPGKDTETLFAELRGVESRRRVETDWDSRRKRRSLKRCQMGNKWDSDEPLAQLRASARCRQAQLEGRDGVKRQGEAVGKDVSVEARLPDAQLGAKASLWWMHLESSNAVWRTRGVGWVGGRGGTGWMRVLPEREGGADGGQGVEYGGGGVEERARRGQRLELDHRSRRRGVAWIPGMGKTEDNIGGAEACVEWLAVPCSAYLWLVIVAVMWMVAWPPARSPCLHRRHPPTGTLDSLSQKPTPDTRYLSIGQPQD
ncbi:hypothetical protein DFP72DRAFT_851591 [Ephemerocybe angulata]|uniref:Uncharacterized protein n=1 Tax=Ephemerocybe angulata TaxID=980116 RepID=A0A8H6HQC8_9AGAR|nr:hypothetical protein DFP72DRAFT_851591 [Tulosesus angulatus]